MFNTVQEAFNYYRDKSLDEIEERAGQIRGTIDTDPDADITKLNIEIEGLNQAKHNIKDKQDDKDSNDKEEQRSFNPITGAQIRGQYEVPKDNIFGSREYRSAFYKKMLGQNLTSLEERTFNTAMQKQDAEHRADNFSSSSNSSAVLPEQTLNEVVRKARTMGGLVGHVRSFNIPTKIRIPIGTPTDKAQWHTEGAEVDAEKPTTAFVQFDGNEIIKVFSISVKVKSMSISAFESYLVDELTSAVVETIDYALVNGTGKDQGEGILTGIKWDSDNSLPLTGKYTDFTQALAKLKQGYGANAKFAMSNGTLYNSVYGLTDNNGRPLFITDAQNETVGHILGKEVVIDDNIEDGTVILGNFDYMGYNLPEGVMLEQSRESSFRSGLVDYRAMAIADTRVLVDEAFVKLSAPTSKPSSNA